MRKTIPLLLCAVVATAFSLGAVARGAAGGGGFSHGSPGGPSSDSKAFENSKRHPGAAERAATR